jgi:3-oxoacyl-[acyl-carrier-protein] synthase II
MRSVVITGIGVLAPGGRSVHELGAMFAAGTHAIRAIEGAPVPWFGGVVDDAGLATGFSRSELGNFDRNSLFAIHACRSAIEDAGLANASRLHAGGVYVGCGGGGSYAIEQNVRALAAGGDVKSTTLVRSMANAAAAHVSIRWGMTGPNLTYSIACASSAVAIGEAWKAIRHGDIDIALAGGTETPLSEAVVRSWAAMRILAKPLPGETEPACRPFSADRNGLLLGEGAAFFILEEEEAARRRGATLHARLRGYACTADASHITAPAAAGQVRTLEAALASAQVNPQDIGYLNAHGTGTSNGDASEAQAIAQVFGEHTKRLHVSSTKGAHGHLIGAAGALELVPTVLALREGLIAPTVNHRQADPECPIDCVPNQAREDRRVRLAMSTSFAFGGSNAALVLERVD